MHAKSIRETLARAQQVIIGNYRAECFALSQMLSQSASRVAISPEVRRRIEDYRTLLPGAQAIAPSRHDPMPYRVLMRQIAERLSATNETRSSGYQSLAQFRADIALVCRSLLESADCTRATFRCAVYSGASIPSAFTSRRSICAQHATVHHRAGTGSGRSHGRAVRQRERHARLVEILERDSGPSGAFDALGKRTLAVFDAVVQSRHRYGPDAIGLYIVGGVSNADDVLAPLVLARWAEAYDKSSGEVALDVAPLFDTVSTLERCGAVMRELLGDGVTGATSMPAAGRRPAGRLLREQSGERHRRLALCGLSSAAAPDRGAREVHKEQCCSTAAAAAFRAAWIASMPCCGPRQPNRSAACCASPSRARPSVRTMDCDRTPCARSSAPSARSRWRRSRSNAGRGPRGAALAECAGLVAGHSAQAWRGLFYEQPQFKEYFRQVTPDRCHRAHADRCHPVATTSMPARHRCGAAGRLGAGLVTVALHAAGLVRRRAGLEFARGERGIELLRRCYRGWPFFRNLIDDIEVMLARSDLAIAAHYDRLAATELRHFGQPLREEYRRSCALVLEIKQCQTLLQSEPTLQQLHRDASADARPHPLHAGGSARALAGDRTAESRAIRGAAGQHQRDRPRFAELRLSRRGARGGRI